MKKILFFTTFLMSLVILFCFIYPNYIILSSYNQGKSGVVNIKKVRSIDLNTTDNTNMTLKKISHCENLKTLFISCNINDLYFLEGLNVDNIYITSNCNNWESVKCIKEVKELYINPMISDTHSTFNDCSVLKKINTIEKLTITNFNDEINYSGIEELSGLKYLAINSSTIDFSRISFPDTLVNLQVQTGINNKGDNLLKNINELADSNVENFSIWNSYIADLSFLSSISNLHKIEFHDCVFCETESEIDSIVLALKNRSVDIVFENNNFS